MNISPLQMNAVVFLDPESRQHHNINILFIWRLRGHCCCDWSKFIGASHRCGEEGRSRTSDRISEAKRSVNLPCIHPAPHSTNQSTQNHPTPRRGKAAACRRRPSRREGKGVGEIKADPSLFLGRVDGLASMVLPAEANRKIHRRGGSKGSVLRPRPALAAYVCR